MGQLFNRRRKLNATDERSGTKSRQHVWSPTVNLFCMTLFPVITCLFVLFVFWCQWSTPNSLKAAISVDIFSIHHEADSPSAGNHTTAIELHAEDHAYRDPETQHLDWTLSSKDIRPDGVLKTVHLINGIDYSYAMK